MKKGLILVVLALMAVTGCNQGAKANKDIVVSKAGSAAGAKADSKPAVKKPANVTLASGQTVKVIEVADLDTDPGKHNGQVAILGKVETVFEDRGAFTLVDAAKMAGCEDACCSPTTVPLNVPSVEYQGVLPKAGDQVIVVGNLASEETGFTFDVLEVRRDDSPILARKAELPATQT